MGITERREREKEEIRRKILDAARDLFVREGYEHVTMRAVADAIEYSPTTIYNHFEDKDDLVAALCNEDFGRLLGALLHEGRPSDPLDWIRQLGRAYAAFGKNFPNHYQFMFMTPAKAPIVKDEASPGEQSFALLADAVKEAIEGGQFIAEEPDEVARVLWAGIHGVVSLLVALSADQWPRGPASPDLVDRVIENGIRGFLKPRG